MPKTMFDAAYPEYHRTGVFRWIAPVYDAGFAFAFFFLGGQTKARQGLVDFGNPPAGGAVLDVGCGTGALAELLAKRVGPQGSVIGVDLSEGMLRVARRRVRGLPWLSFQHVNAESLPFPNGIFDQVYSSYALHEIPEAPRAGVLKEIARVLKPDGSLMVCDFSLPQRGPWRWLMKTFVEMFEEDPAKEVLRRGSLVPDIERAHFRPLRVETVFHGVSVRICAATAGRRTMPLPGDRKEAC